MAVMMLRTYCPVESARRNKQQRLLLEEICQTVSLESLLGKSLSTHDTCKLLEFLFDT